MPPWLRVLGFRVQGSAAAECWPTFSDLTKKVEGGHAVKQIDMTSRSYSGRTGFSCMCRMRREHVELCMAGLHGRGHPWKD